MRESDALDLIGPANERMDLQLLIEGAERFDLPADSEDWPRRRAPLPKSRPAQQSEEGGRRESSDRRFADARRFLRSHFFMPLSVRMVAEIANMSEYHFSRNYRVRFGQSPYQELLALRMQFALHLIKQTKMVVSDIAVAVGFDSRSNLFRHFVRFHGVSPSVLRQRLRRDATSDSPATARAITADTRGASRRARQIPNRTK